jgi:AcrR family transcriptional regulator
MGGMTRTRRRGDTRGEIQRAALRRFNVQGYDKTSLREIAEDLGVTKAAVYYHFPTKEDILESLVRDVAASLDEIITWTRSQPTTREVRLEVLRRLAEATMGGLGDLMRCVQNNELAMAALPETVSIVHRYKGELWRAATPPDPTVEDLIRARMAILTVLFANHGDELGGTAQERIEASQKVAAEIMP